MDASLISADVQKQNPSKPDDWAARDTDPNTGPRAVREYLDTLDDEAFGVVGPAHRWLVPVAAKGQFEFRPSDWLSMAVLATSAAMQRGVRRACEWMLRQQTVGRATAAKSA